MGKNKLRKFSEMENFRCVLQYPREKLLAEGFPYKGKWNDEYFKNRGSITLELGCGKGEYAVALAKENPEKNFIGVDIKGARMWSGAKEAELNEMENISFLRTEIENINNFFGPEEVEEIWITFPDPQMQKMRKRLTSTRFLEMYGLFLRNDGVINLKTDSPFLYEYTKRLIELNGLEIVKITDDLYGTGEADPVSSIKTYYESQWLSRGKKIKLITFKLNQRTGLKEPPVDDIQKDDYRAYTRHTL